MEKWMQDKQGIQQDLLDSVQDSDTVAPARQQSVAGTQGEMFQYESHRAMQFAGACPDCGSQLEFAEGCVKCHVCGYSECG